MTLVRTLAAGLFAAIAAAAPGAAQSADLDGYEQPYGNSEYDNQYNYESRRAEADHDYDDGSDDSYRPNRYRGSYKDGEYLEPMNRPPRYADQNWRGRDGCAPRWQIRQRMIDSGWRDIRRLRVLREVVVLRASRPSGRTFDLKLDRCTGDIVDRRPSYINSFNGYAPSYRRYSRTY